MSGAEGYSPTPTGDSVNEKRRASLARAREAKAALREAKGEKPPPRKRVQEERRRRRRRSTYGDEANMKLHVAEDLKDTEYEYRWIRDEPGRVRRMTVQDDWDLVEDENLSSEDLQRGLGVVPERPGGIEDGRAYNMVLVRKPRDLYEEDEAEKQRKIDDNELGIKHGPGGLKDTEALSGPTAYTPEGGIKLEQKANPDG